MTLYEHRILLQAVRISLREKQYTVAYIKTKKAFQHIMDLCISSHTKTWLLLITENNKINRYIFLLYVSLKKKLLSVKDKNKT